MPTPNYSRLRLKTATSSSQLKSLMPISASFCARRSLVTSFVFLLTIFGLLRLIIYSSNLRGGNFSSHRPTSTNGPVKQLNSDNTSSAPQFNLADLPTESPALGDYLIHTESCIIPRVPLFTAEILPFYSPTNSTSKDYHCAKTSIADHIVRLNATAVFIPPSLSGCSAREVVWSWPNEGQTFGRSWTSVQSGDDFPTTEAILIECSGDVKKLLPLVPVKQPYQWDEVPRLERSQLSQNPVNVLMIGIDAVSRLNLIRHMRRTVAFLDRHNFTSFLGHHKVGDNTMPNLFGMFLGLAKDDWWSRLPASKKLDSLPLIFKRFSNANYMTTYIEDYPACGLFTFHGVKGFSKRPPTEYYLRPVNLWLRKKSLYDHTWCTGGQLEMEYYYDYILEQMAAFRTRRQPHLTWIHQSTVSHEEVNLCQWTDGPVVRLLERIFAGGHNRNTVIAFYSDHAIRIGKILETESGFHETRLPFFYLYAPEELRLMTKDSGSGEELLDSKKLRTILQENSHRLTSHMDIHATLRHLLTGSPPTDEPFGRSLFTPIPSERTCSQAGVPEEYCLCKHFVALSSDHQTAKAIANKLVNGFNEQLRRSPEYAVKCSALALDRVVTAKIAFDGVDKGEKKALVNRRQAMISLVFTVVPSGAKFDATVKTTFLNEGASTDDLRVDLNATSAVGKIARNDRYGEQSACVAGSPVETFCYCRNRRAEGGGDNGGR